MSVTDAIRCLKEELPNDIELVAVSKFHPCEAIQEAYQVEWIPLGKHLNIRCHANTSW